MYRTYNGKTVEFNGQQEKIYKHLKSHGSLSQLEALGVYGIYRLAARVCEMRRKGVPIDSDNKHDANGKVYASYFINPEYKWREPKGVSEAVITSNHNYYKGKPIPDKPNTSIRLERVNRSEYNILVSEKDSYLNNEQIILGFNIDTGTITTPVHYNEDVSQMTKRI
jgi:hypothetical protein